MVDYGFKNVLFLEFMFFLQTAFEWFTEGITDLEYETQSNLFTSRMLKFDVSKISRKGWSVFSFPVILSSCFVIVFQYIGVSQIVGRTPQGGPVQCQRGRV